jgi:hypothetical protein
MRVEIYDTNNTRWNNTWTMDEIWKIASQEDIEQDFYRNVCLKSSVMFLMNIQPS